jgi:hypothetical protein
MKTRLVSSTVMLAATLFAAVTVGFIVFVSISWSALPMIAGCYIVGGIVFLAFRDYSTAPSYGTPDIHTLAAHDRDRSHASIAATVELRAA